MAELTPTSGNGNNGNGNGAAGPAGAIPSAAADPRAVRVRLAPASRTADEPAIRIGPAPEPLHMTNPTVGRGPLGGAAMAPVAAPAEGVLAQRHVHLDGEPVDVAVTPMGSGRWVLAEGGSASRVILESESEGDGGTRIREVLVDGFRFEVETESERIASLRERASQGRAASAHSGPLQVKAIIPGKVVAVSVKAGDTVTAGQQLLVVEAMKMQNELRAPRDGTIDRVGVTVGVNIEIGDLLVVIS